MRLVALTLTAHLLASALAFCQAPADDPRLTNYLKRWEQEMSRIQTLAAQLNRTEKDTTFNTTQKFVGYAQYMKSGTGPTAVNLATLEMRPENKRDEIYEKFVITPAFLYQFQPSKKEIQAFALPKPKEGQVGEDNFLTFLFGMKAEEARKRYDLKLTNEDQNYIYVTILPRNPQDKADFSKAQIVLNRDTFLPRRLWFEASNGSETTWDIPAIRSGVQVNRQEFDAPTPPAGWKLIQMPKNTEGPPKVIRSGQ
jgi:TIGR03009 family protein